MKKISIIIAFLCLTVTITAQTQLKSLPEPQIKFALNAFSFNSLLMGLDKTKPSFTLFDLLDWCASQNIDAVDLTGYYFPGYPEVPTDEYIYKIKRKAHQLGIQISGTGIKNNFASPDSAFRAAEVARTKKWILVAAKLGAPVIRLFSGDEPIGYEKNWNVPANWTISCIKECAVYAEKQGVIIGIQNHGDMLKTAEQCTYVLKGVNSDWCGLILDIGSFRVKDPFVDIETMVPYAVNWQVKDPVYGINKEIVTDEVRLMEILKRSHYRGYIPIETLPVVGQPYDPFLAIPTLLSKLRIAKEKVFK